MWTQALSHPFLLLVGCALLIELVSRLLPRSSAGGPAPQYARRLSAVPVLLYVAILGFYLLTPAYEDHVEPSVTAVSWAIVQGQPAYPDPDGPAMYGLPYGPMLFLANGLTMRVLGPGLASSKVAGCAAALASLLLVAIALRRAPVPDRRAALALMPLLYLTFGAASFWVRAEPLLLLCAAASVLSVTVPALPAVVVAGVSLGLATNLKVSAPIYLIPALALLWRRHGLPAVVGVVAISAVIAAAPFLVSGTFSPSTYLYWLGSAASEGVRIQGIPGALERAAFLSMPLLMAAGDRRCDKELSGMTLFRVTLVASMLLSLPAAIKHGTGPYHFLPFVPSVVYAGRLRTWLLIRPSAMIAACVTIAFVALSMWVPPVTALPGRQIVEELRHLERLHAGTSAMGYSAAYRPSFFRPVLVFDGQPYVLDSASVMDWHWRGRPFPPAVIDGLRKCAVQTWMLPRGAPPFQLPNAYPVAGDIFPEEFRRAFQENYVLETRGQWFDVWRCGR